MLQSGAPGAGHVTQHCRLQAWDPADAAVERQREAQRRAAAVKEAEAAVAAAAAAESQASPGHAAAAALIKGAVAAVQHLDSEGPGEAAVAAMRVGHGAYTSPYSQSALLYMTMPMTLA